MLLSVCHLETEANTVAILICKLHNVVWSADIQSRASEWICGSCGPRIVIEYQIYTRYQPKQTLILTDT